MKVTRSRSVDLEVRSDGRTVAGIAVPFDSPAEVIDAEGQYRETFRRGAFERTIRERGDRVKFLVAHEHDKLPVGRALLLREDTAGLYGEFRVSETVAGDELLELIRDGAVDALSIGFRPIRSEWSRGRAEVERLEVRLDEVSAVTFPAFEDARVLAVREEADRVLSFDDAFERLTKFGVL